MEQLDQAIQAPLNSQSGRIAVMLDGPRNSLEHQGKAVQFFWSIQIYFGLLQQGRSWALIIFLQECWLLCSTGTLHLPAGVFCVHTGALLLVLLLSRPRVLEGHE